MTSKGLPSHLGHRGHATQGTRERPLHAIVTPHGPSLGEPIRANSSPSIDHGEASGGTSHEAAGNHPRCSTALCWCDG